MGAFTSSHAHSFAIYDRGIRANRWRRRKHPTQSRRSTNPACASCAKRWLTTFAGYRLYSDSDVHRLRFIKRARGLGFAMKEVEQLLGLWADTSRASAEVKELAKRHADELGERIAEMQAMQRTLQNLARRCHGNDRPDCPILDDLSGGVPPHA